MIIEGEILGEWLLFFMKICRNLRIMEWRWLFLIVLNILWKKNRIFKFLNCRIKIGIYRIMMMLNEFMFFVFIGLSEKKIKYLV